ncbi:hypothetical protein EBZ39_13645 [bacterium]|nr:hypothetical protein [bacterium]
MATIVVDPQRPDSSTKCTDPSMAQCTCRQHGYCKHRYPNTNPGQPALGNGHQDARRLA